MTFTLRMGVGSRRVASREMAGGSEVVERMDGAAVGENRPEGGVATGDWSGDWRGERKEGRPTGADGVAVAAVEVEAGCPGSLMDAVGCGVAVAVVAGPAASDFVGLAGLGILELEPGLEFVVDCLGGSGVDCAAGGSGVDLCVSLLAVVINENGQGMACGGTVTDSILCCISILALLKNKNVFIEKSFRTTIVDLPLDFISLEFFLQSTKLARSSC